MDLECNECYVKLQPVWKYCGKCGTYLNRGGVKNKKGKLDVLNNVYTNILEKTKKSQLKHKSAKRRTSSVLAAYEVENGFHVESCLVELHKEKNDFYSWKQPELPIPHVEEKFESMTLPTRPHSKWNIPLRGPPVLEAIHNTRLDAFEARTSQPLAILFPPPVGFADKKCIAALWTIPSAKSPRLEPIAATPVFDSQEKIPTGRLKSPDGMVISLFDRVEAWPNKMGSRFRLVVTSMRTTLELCDVNVVNFRGKNRISSLKDIHERLLANIYDGKETLHAINDEHIAFYGDLEQARLEVMTALANSMSDAVDQLSPDGSVPRGIGISSTLSKIEDREKDEIDSILRLR